jgi:hypothetical protein
MEQYAALKTGHPGNEGTRRLMAQITLTRGQPVGRGVGNHAARASQQAPRRIEVAKRHPLKALKVFALILFDVIAEIRHEREYRKEFKA